MGPLPELPDLRLVFALAGVGLLSVLAGSVWLLWWLVSSFTSGVC